MTLRNAIKIGIKSYLNIYRKCREKIFQNYVDVNEKKIGLSKLAQGEIWHTKFVMQ